MEKRNRVLKNGPGAEGLQKAKKDILGAFAVAERVRRAIDNVLSPEEEELEEEPPPPPAPPQKADAIVLGRNASGALQVDIRTRPAPIRRRGG